MHVLDMEHVVPRTCALVIVIGKDPIALFVSYFYDVLFVRIGKL